MHICFVTKKGCALCTGDWDVPKASSISAKNAAFVCMDCRGIVLRRENRNGFGVTSIDIEKLINSKLWDQMHEAMTPIASAKLGIKIKEERRNAR